MGMILPRVLENSTVLFGLPARAGRQEYGKIAVVYQHPMPVRSFHADALEVRVYETRAEMGAAAAAEGAAAIREILSREALARAIFASAPSQNEFLAGLRASREIDWTRVEAFHMDEYLGIAADHPASFRRFLRDRLIDCAPVRAFHELRGDAADWSAECERYAALLNEARPDLVALGVGENGHLAFIDPPVCDFSDPRTVRLVDLEEVCRAQQVHDGMFARLEDVPKQALSLTIPVFMRTPRAVCIVPGNAKARAVRAALEGPVTEACPASVLRRHPHATLFLDRDSAALLAVQAQRRG
jgi:glucosamine-6-phosphate deaminase